MTYNRITAEIGESRRITTRPISYQYDTVQILMLTAAEGVELPEFYQVDFCVIGDEDTVTMVGSLSGGALIPDSLLRQGENLMAYLVLTGTESDAQTRYEITIPVNERPTRSGIELSDDQQAQVDSLVEALNEGVDRAEAAAEAIQDMGVEAETLAPGSPLTVTKEVDPETGAVTLIFGLTQGPKGDDGYSPTITITEITGGHRFTVTDKTHPSGQSFDVLDGAKGDQGDDGYSPVVTITTITGGHRVTITDKTHPSGQSFDVMDGASDAGQVSYDPTQTYPDGSIGKEVSNQKNALNLNVTWIDGGYINGNGTISSNAAFKYTDFIEISDVFFKIGYTLYLNPNAFVVAMYDADKLYIANSGVNGAGNDIPKSGFVAYPSENDELHIPKYIRFSHCKASAGIANPEPVINLANVAKPVITDNVISSSKLKEKSVTKEKCTFIVHDPESNYINKTKYSNGYINASGVFVANDGWRATDYCELLPNTHYYGSGLHGGYCAFYKADKTVINAYGANSFTISSFTTPAETAYARFSLNASSQSVDTAWINIKNEKPDDYSYILDGVDVSVNTDNPCDYDGREIAVFNKILCVGDSMTEGTFNHLDSGSTQWVSYEKYSYPTYLHKMTGVDVTNLGHGGKTSVEWYAMEENSDLSGYDCAIIQLGINDVGTYTTWGSNSEDAFSAIITKLKTQNKNIKIFVANIIPATSYSSSDYKDFSDDMLDWLETEYASDSSVIPLDIQRYGHTRNSSAYNCGHLSALGYHRLAEDYNNYISWYINQNKDVFREVQFIGTDYWYTNPNS